MFIDEEILKGRREACFDEEGRPICCAGIVDLGISTGHRVQLSGIGSVADDTISYGVCLEQSEEILLSDACGGGAASCVEKHQQRNTGRKKDHQDPRAGRHAGLIGTLVPGGVWVFVGHVTTVGSLTSGWCQRNDGAELWGKEGGLADRPFRKFET